MQKAIEVRLLFTVPFFQEEAILLGPIKVIDNDFYSLQFARDWITLHLEFDKF